MVCLGHIVLLRTDPIIRPNGLRAKALALTATPDPSSSDTPIVDSFAREQGVRIGEPGTDERLRGEELESLGAGLPASRYSVEDAAEWVLQVTMYRFARGRSRS